MKVKFKYGISTYSGTLDDMTYGSYRNGMVCIGRKRVIPRLTDNNVNMGKIAKNLATIYREVSDLYKDDLKVYAQRNGKQNTPKNQLPPTAYAIFLKMMHAWSKSEDPQLDLSALTIEDIETGGDKIATLADAIDNGLLARVSVYNDLINLI
ncbi:MAG: hypothetical protein Q8M98_01440 [Candidatus Cloacimonadaceae bacterium]|nr:hypothetical protein [Candidatus Cloacimonadaceae bacterium]MDP3113415.1 hypothetical protein [Candidatus Cloacimonadaceae bacterium]